MKIRKLETAFVGIGEKKGIEFQQIEKNDKYVIYKLSDGTYELFNYKIQEMNDVFNKKCIEEGYTHYEVYPASNAFGNWAWVANSKHHLQVLLNEKFGIGDATRDLKSINCWSLFN